MEDWMSLQSDAAKVHIEKLLEDAYPTPNPLPFATFPNWFAEYLFAPPRKWRFDYAVPSILCASYESFLNLK